MDASFIQALQAAENPEDKAVLIAEASLSMFSAETARVARQCVLFHWFDQSIVAALLQAVSPDTDSAQDVYQQITSLPFVEQLLWGVAYQDLTRQGLLKYYARTQPELLRSAARIAVPIYRASTENNRYAAEALFCSVISGDPASNLHLNTSLEHAMNQQDWQQMEGLFRLQEEAEQLSFVESLPRTEDYWMLRSIVDRVQDRLDAALLDYGHVLAINPQNALAYLNRSIVHRQQMNYRQALTDYNEAFRLDPALVQTYIGTDSLENDDSSDANNDTETHKLTQQESLGENAHSQESLDEDEPDQENLSTYSNNRILPLPPNRERRRLVGALVASVVTLLAGSGAVVAFNQMAQYKIFSSICFFGQTNCKGACVDLSNDPSHCGSCDRVCPSGANCVKGVCHCPSGQTDCNGTCINLKNDSKNCGSCGNVCPANSTCLNGTCVCNYTTCGSTCCQSGYSCCNGTCVDTNSDSSNCGICGNTCDTQYLSCSGGKCVCAHVTCNDGSCCNIGNPVCCYNSSGSTFACCPSVYPVCCSNYCCQSGYSCCNNGTCC